MIAKFFQRYSLKTRVTLFTLAIFLLSLWSLAFYVSRMLYEDMKRLSGEQQFSTVSFVAGSVNDELIERIRALELVASNFEASILLKPEAAQQLLEQRPILNILFNAGAFITGVDGTALASLPVSAGRVGINYMDRAFLTTSLREGKAVIGQPVIGKRLKSPVFVMSVPIRDAQGGVIGALLGVTDLSQPNFLDNLTGQSYGKTGGYLLIAPQYRLVITATDKTRIMDTLPAPGVSPVIDRFILGYEGYDVFTNPRGVEVLAAARGVPAAGWYVGSQLPVTEAFAPIDDMQKRMVLATIVLTLLAGSLTWWMLRRQFRPMSAAVERLAALSEERRPRQPLPIECDDEIGMLIGAFNRLIDTLGQREAVLRQILDTSSVAIFLVDLQGRITQANQQMAGMFGCPLDALVGNEYVALVHPDERDEGRQKMLALLASEIASVALDRRYSRADGSEFWGHLTGTRFYDATGRALGLVGVIADIDTRRQAEDGLRASEKRFRDFFEKNSSVMFLMDPSSGEIADANASAAAYFGYPRAQLLGMPINCINITPLAQLVELRQQVLRDESHYFNFPYRLASGEVRDVEVYATPINNVERSLLFCIVHDITERKLAEEKLLLAASVFTHAREGIMITAADGAIIDVNAAFTRLTGYSRDEVLGRNPRILNSGRQQKEFYAALWHELLENGQWTGEVWNRRKSGEVYAEMLTISAVRDLQGNIRQYVSLFSDITTIKAHESQLEHLAHYDALTCLPNRVLLADRLHQAMVQTERRGQRLAVVYLDLDGFKAVNDNHGHEAGDQLLMAVASRMKDALRDGDTLARLGGDEFVAVLLDVADISDSLPMFTRLLDAASTVVQFDEIALQVSASLGVTFYPQTDALDADQLLRQADQAMYQAKLAGKNRYHLFDAEQDRNARGHHESLEHIRHGFTERQFVLYYQPKVNMRSGQLIGAEALIRWQHPEQGLVSPAMFLPVIEDHPLAVELGDFVIDTALSQIEAWQAAGLDFPVSVNVGARQLQQAGFFERLQVLLAAHPLVKPFRLQIEVLETSALEDLARVSQIIDDCREIGVSFALDDFGTGYSSLTYLKHLQVAQLKIDQTFVRDMLEDPDDLAIIEGVLGLANAFRRQVIAEGVETVEHGEMLLQLGCELAQGYGIARPMPAADLPGWAATWQPDPRWFERLPLSRDELPLLHAGVEHRAWVAVMTQYLNGTRAKPPALAIKACRFGHWLDASAGGMPGQAPTFQAVDALHHEVHELAAALCDLYRQGRRTEALAGVEKLHGVRDALLAQLTTLLR
jgi:diguanylate cyclase (GGDEF)-like protein/PAS domain S-box-containing protein